MQSHAQDLCLGDVAKAKLERASFDLASRLKSSALDQIVQHITQEYKSIIYIILLQLDDLRHRAKICKEKSRLA
jgi:hypothetical protein